MAARKTKQQSAVLWWIPFHLLLVSFALKFMYPSNSKLSKSPNYSIMYALCLPHGYNLRFSRFSKLALSLSFVFFSSQVLLIKKCTSSAVPFVLPSTKTTKKGMAFVFPLHFPIFFFLCPFSQTVAFTTLSMNHAFVINSRVDGFFFSNGPQFDGGARGKGKTLAVQEGLGVIRYLW